ncbi:MAG TPA: red chlorophyll catabolite reductase, partial [Cyanobacteria bacterium UBA11162]|nr:red chlorophyll catabolite reductase [Cyanobacteria bacterium UBA11162]
LWSDLNYLERYYEPLQSTYLTLRGNSDLSLFVSKSLYVRQIQSPTHLCYTCSPTEESLALIQRLAHEMLERWFKWVDDAEPVPETMQPILAQRDRCMRRISAERDPGNQMAAQLFGAELTNTLVRGLWGGDRFVQ